MGAVGATSGVRLGLDHTSPKRQRGDLPDTSPFGIAQGGPKYMTLEAISLRLRVNVESLARDRFVLLDLSNSVDLWLKRPAEREVDHESDESHESERRLSAE